MKSGHCHHKGEQRVEALFVDTSLLRELDLVYLASFMIVCRLNGDALSIYVQGMAKDKIPRCIFVGGVAHFCYEMTNLSVLFFVIFGQFHQIAKQLFSLF